MAKPIDSRTLFLTTSPRTPEKMFPEIALLMECFGGQEWNHDTQQAFMQVLRERDFFHGKGEKDPAFSARDRINRAPKSLGFLLLKPALQLTPAGEKLLASRRKDEVLLRQMLKFQIPSPYHQPTTKAADFCIKPYLEILRLVRVLGTLKFDELQIFAMQMTNWHDFECIVKKIEKFRAGKAEHKGKYNAFRAECLRVELREIYEERILRGETGTRESADRSLDKFLATQASNMRDYADACFRYLRATGLVAVSHIGKSLSIVPEKVADVDYILSTVPREPIHVDDEKAYVGYLGDATLPKLLTDNREMLEEKIRTEFPDSVFSASTSLEELKDLLASLLDARKQETIAAQTAAIKDCRQYEEIQQTYEHIGEGSRKLFDAPLLLEWNTWRAMTMLDGGDISANLNFDDYGQPLSTAAGNMPDIVCDYGDYMVCVEVTMATGQRQYEMEGEPVTRHLGKIKMASGKPCYCLFIAPEINPTCISYFFALHRIDLAAYGGKSAIVPLPLKVFQKMLEDSYKAAYTPKPSHLRCFLDGSVALAQSCADETAWHKEVVQRALRWLE